MVDKIASARYHTFIWYPYKKHLKRWAWLLDGDNACPPEDVGGIEGFRQMVKTLKTKPDSPQAKEYIDWLGYKYNPEIFNMAEAYKFMMDSMKRNYS